MWAGPRVDQTIGLTYETGNLTLGSNYQNPKIIIYFFRPNLPKKSQKMAQKWSQNEGFLLKKVEGILPEPLFVSIPPLNPPLFFENLKRKKIKM